MASSYDSHVVKRQKTDGGDVSFREPAQDRHNPEVSPVVHVRGVPDHAFEEDIVSSVQHFGTVQYCMILRGRRQALVEFSDTKGSSACVNFANSNQLCIAGTPAFFNFSTSQRIQRPSNQQGQGQMGENGRPYQNVPGNKILLFTVLNAKYPITVDVMHTICSSHGRVEKIVIFRKQYVQALVQYENLEASKAAKEQLQGCDIYSGCCTLRVEYAKTDELNVRANNSDSWDYTQPSQSDSQPRKGAPLLADPRFSAQPTPFEGQASGYDDYGGDQQQGYSQRGYEAEGAYQGFGAPAVSRGMTSPQGRGMGAMGRGGGMGNLGRGRGGAQGGYGGEVGGYGGRGALQETPGYGAYADPQAVDSFPQGCVLMLYGLSAEHMNCDRVFNLFCLYGNVVRIKFLKTKEGSAMIQMGDSQSVERAIFNLNGVFAFESKLVVTLSKQPYLQVVNNPHDLPDGTCSYKDFSSNNNNRFRNQDQAVKNRIIHTTEILHFFNAPPTINEDQIKQVFEEAGAKVPKKILQFPVKSGKSSSGLAEWESKQDSVEALILTNHVPVDNPEGGGRPYYIKLCFSPSSIRETN